MFQSIIMHTKMIVFVFFSGYERDEIFHYLFVKMGSDFSTGSLVDESSNQLGTHERIYEVEVPIYVKW